MYTVSPAVGPQHHVSSRTTWNSENLRSGTARLEPRGLGPAVCRPVLGNPVSARFCTHKTASVPSVPKGHSNTGNYVRIELGRRVWAAIAGASLLGVCPEAPSLPPLRVLCCLAALAKVPVDGEQQQWARKLLPGHLFGGKHLVFALSVT